MHVHVHCMMTAGGIDLKTGQWVDIPQDVGGNVGRNKARRSYCRGIPITHP
ncbi:MAG: transposase [Pirellula sp.]